MTDRILPILAVLVPLAGAFLAALLLHRFGWIVCVAGAVVVALLIAGAELAWIVHQAKHV